MKISRPQSPILIFILSILVFLVFDNLIFRSDFFNDLFLLKGGEAISQQYYAFKEIKNFTADNRSSVLLIGSSEFRYPLDQKKIKNLHNINTNIVMPNMTSEEEWYYLLKSGDPKKNKYKLVVVALPHYKITPEFEQKASIRTSSNLANFVSWRDYIDIIMGYSSFKDRIEAAEFKLFPSQLYPHELLYSFFSPLKKDFSSTPEQRKEYFLSKHQGVWNDAIFNKKGKLLECRDPQSLRVCQEIEEYKVLLKPKEAYESTQKQFKFESEWIQKIVNYYKDTKTKVVFIELPSAPGINQGTPIANAPDVRKTIILNQNVKFTPESQFSDLGTGNLMYDPYHLSPVWAKKQFTQRLIEVINANL